MSEIKEWAKREAELEYELDSTLESRIDEWCARGFVRGILHLAEELHREDVIEAMAKAMFEREHSSAWEAGKFIPSVYNGYRNAARAALAAMLAKITEGAAS